MDLPRLAIADAVGCLSFYNLEIEDVDEEVWQISSEDDSVLMHWTIQDVCICSSRTSSSTVYLYEQYLLVFGLV